MEYVAPLLGVVLGGGMIGSIWYLACNEMTFKQRLRLINARPQDRAIEDTMFHEFHDVEYNAHLWALFVFRDPKKLYGPVTQSRWPWRGK